ncbi:MAG TPA: hypothetical protein VIK38_12490, partial [Coriobacteriia bacterium]
PEIQRNWLAGFHDSVKTLREAGFLDTPNGRLAAAAVLRGYIDVAEHTLGCDVTAARKIVDELGGAMPTPPAGQAEM